ncbi:MAG: DinB family protein [Acidimicrobiaceae bacterium]|nr:DinB family protein [Acidimicrobiaceae bacterium]
MATALELSPEGFLFMVDRAFDGMVRILNALGDDLVNERPDLEGANSPFGIVTHCVGLTRWWSDEVAGGGKVPRDREAEFPATGKVADLVAEVPAARRAVADAVAAGDWAGKNRGAVPPAFADTPIGATRGGVLLHVYEELAQHLGQLEITRDILLARSA